MNNFNINEIEEVESSPKRRTKQKNNKIQRNNPRINQTTFAQKFGYIEKLLMGIFLISLFVLFFTVLIIIIFSIKKILLPKIFMPSILIYILTFFFAGGILGTYVNPLPGRMYMIRKNEILMMRNFTPIIMLIICIILGVFSLNNIKSMEKNIKKAQKICESNKGLSMEEIYLKLNKTNYDLQQARYNLIYIFNNNLVCFPKGKCFKLIKENHYICNIDNYINYYNNISDIKCNKIYFENKNEDYKNQSKMIKLFFENCEEINKNNLGIYELYDCQSKENLEKIKLISNWDENNKIKIENFFNNKLEKYNSEIQKIDKMISEYDKSEFNYDLECYNSLDYKLSFFLINSYCIIYYLISFSWIYLGLMSIYEIFKLIKNEEINDNNNTGESRNVINLSQEENNNLIN